MKSIHALIPLILLFVSGCATMDKSECLNADWYTVGFEDGVSGENVSRIGEYRQDCAKHNISPQLDPYRAGHYEGSKKFCTSQNGFNQGKRGKGHNHSCPDDLSANFLSAYKDGKYIYELRSHASSLKNTLDDMHYRLERIEKVLVQKNEDIVADGLNREQRIAIREELKELIEEKKDIQADIPFIHTDWINAQEAYESQARKLNKLYL